MLYALHPAILLYNIPNSPPISMLIVFASYFLVLALECVSAEQQYVHIWKCWPLYWDLVAL